MIGQIVFHFLCEYFLLKEYNCGQKIYENFQTTH